MWPNAFWLADSALLRNYQRPVFLRTPGICSVIFNVGNGNGFSSAFEIESRFETACFVQCCHLVVDNIT